MLNLRRCLRLIRDPETKPSHLMPNGKTASEAAHEYVVEGTKRRNEQKRKRNEHAKKARPEEKAARKQLLHAPDGRSDDSPQAQ